MSVPASAAPERSGHAETVDVREVAPGCAVRAFRNGKPVYTRYEGFADLASRRPLGENTQFYAASISKQFTALVIAKLAQEGRLNLDDPLRRHIPEMPPYAERVTIQMLLNHTAGIRDSLTLIRMAGFESPAAANEAAALRLTIAQHDTSFEPGSRFEYSNGGYLLLAEVARRAGGAPLSLLADRYIFAPLKMRDSYMLAGEFRAGARANGYAPRNGNFQVRNSFPRFSGSGGLITTLRDFSLYERDFDEGATVWTPAIKAMLLAPGRLSDGQPAIRPIIGLTYAGGLMVGQRHGVQIIQHGGGAEGFKNSYVRLPERHLAVAVFCNRGDRDAGALAFATLEQLRQPDLADDAARGIEGAYRSDELGVVYTIRKDDSGVDVTIARDGDTKAVANFHAAQAGPDRFQGSGVIIEWDSGELFLTRGAVRGLRLQRLAPPPSR